ncbi:MAG: copper amine oxidase N-terminal domain-containing protein [Bacillota bacterium]
MRGNKMLVLFVLSVFVAGLALALPVAPSAAQLPTVTINSAGFNKTSVLPGDSVQATIEWSKIGAGDPTVVVRVLEPLGAAHYQEEVVLQGESGTKTIGFTVGDCAAAGTYRLSVLYGGIEILTGTPPGFEVEAVNVTVYITSPTASSPVVVKPGGQVIVNFVYTASAPTKVEVAVENTGLALSIKSVSVSQSGVITPAAVTLNIPDGAAEGRYAMTVRRCGAVLHSVPNAVEVKRNPVVSAAVTAPTQSEPVDVKAGSTVRITVRYTSDENTAADVRLMSGSTVLASTGVDLVKTTSERSQSVNLTVPSGTAPGRYDLVVAARPDGEVLNRAREAVRVVESVSIDITSPTRSSPVSVGPGGKVTVQFDYTADAATNVDVKLVDSDGKSLVSASTPLDKTSTKKSKSVTLTVPSSASGGKYDVVVAGRTSGAELDKEREAVLLEAKVDADITSPTRTQPVTVQPGDRVSVVIEYTADAAAEIELKLVDSGGSTLVSRTVSLSRSTAKRSQTESLTVPSSASGGKYDLVAATKEGNKTLDTEKEAVAVEGRVQAGIISPSRSQPVTVKPGDRVNVEFEYTAETSAEVDVLLKGSDGKTLVSRTVSLARATTKRSQTISLTVPSPASGGKYDVVVARRTSGTALAVQKEAVQLSSHPVGVAVRFVIGQAGRWAGNAYQTTDCAPMLLNGRTFLPVRHVGEPLGWQFEWDADRKMTTVVKGDLWVRVWINEPGARISRDGGNTWMVAAIDPDNRAVRPVIVDGRTMLPLRFVAESLDTVVDWDGRTQTVTVTQNR